MFQEGRQKLLDFKGLVSSYIVILFNILLVDVSTTTAFHLLFPNPPPFQSSLSVSNHIHFTNN